MGTTLTAWTQQGAADSTQRVTPSTYTVLDNLQWLKGKHAITLGFTYQWQEINTSAPVGYTGLVQLPFNSYSTAQYTANSGDLSSASGNSYASFLLGAVGNNGSAAPSLGCNQ